VVREHFLLNIVRTGPRAQTYSFSMGTLVTFSVGTVVTFSRGTATETWNWLLYWIWCRGEGKIFLYNKTYLSF